MASYGNASAEEVECIAGLMDGLVQAGVNWIDDKGRSRPLRLDDVLIVAPYKCTRSDLLNRISNALVGTVDRFQGQQAAPVVYSQTTSSPEDAPRGMEFLYSLNRVLIRKISRCVGRVAQTVNEVHDSAPLDAALRHLLQETKVHENLVSRHCSAIADSAASQIPRVSPSGKSTCLARKER